MVATDPALPGPTETGLNTTLERYAVGVRILVILAGAALALVGAPADPLPVVAVTLLATAWCALTAWWTWGRRTPPHPALPVAAAISALLVVELTQPWTVVGPYNGWAFSVASITCITMQLEQSTRPRLGLLVAGVAAVSYTAGAAMTRELTDAALFAPASSSKPHSPAAATCSSAPAPAKPTTHAPGPRPNAVPPKSPPPAAPPNANTSPPSTTPPAPPS
ncbi:hypothetical protein BJF85_23790 [Saccharomonospora sp. CUA-673]|uniref:hypothetical protein n=1 Tax=Saccharomonospora sp. CUA-673 TaxID=1904969 RepID=UPI00095F45C5|nr:hypothetical protein [Saccharomonospora sp. CUA-673]OLT41360.1 hypothetical protein BJF85_23790 [Saccharomonospora sp. CUA-673]